MKTINIKQKIRDYFLMNPTAKLRVRQIERELRLPLPSVIRYCRELEKEKILKKEQFSGIEAYSANRVSNRFLIEKKLFNIRLIYDSNLIEYLIKEYSNPVVILFGSFSRGEDIEKSDIDLYLEISSKKEAKLEKFERILKRKIQTFRYSNLKQITNPHLANNIINGVILNGFLEVFK